MLCVQNNNRFFHGNGFEATLYYVFPCSYYTSERIAISKTLLNDPRWGWGGGMGVGVGVDTCYIKQTFTAIDMAFALYEVHLM